MKCYLSIEKDSFTCQTFMKLRQANSIQFPYNLVILNLTLVNNMVNQVPSFMAVCRIPEIPIINTTQQTAKIQTYFFQLVNFLNPSGNCNRALQAIIPSSSSCRANMLITLFI